MAGTTFPIFGYPARLGGKKLYCFDWQAVNPYVVGGLTYNAQGTFNEGGFEGGFGSVSQSGNYRAEFRFSAKGSQQSVKIVIFVMATGLEAGAIDLSTEVFKLALIAS